jgi:hypothetical protein
MQDDPSSSTEPVEPVQVELDIFSGRPNPAWTLNSIAARHLVHRHLHLERIASTIVTLPGLGYRGFLYDLDGTRWRAVGGLVIGPAQTLADPNRSVERQLLSGLPGEWIGLRERVELAMSVPPSDDTRAGEKC